MIEALIGLISIIILQALELRYRVGRIEGQLRRLNSHINSFRSRQNSSSVLRQDDQKRG